MATLAPGFVSSLDVGAPTLNSVFNSFADVMDWVLVTKAGWTLLQTATGIRVYKMSGGSERCLYVNHTQNSHMAGGEASNAFFAEIRGCETASAASFAGLVNPFPNAYQCPSMAGLGSGNISNAAVCPISILNNNASARWYCAWYTDHWVRFLVNVENTTPYAEPPRTSSRGNLYTWFYGDVHPRFSFDSYATMLQIQSKIRLQVPSYLYGGGGISYFAYDSILGNPGFWTGNSTYWARDITGTIVSTQGAYDTTLFCPGGTPPRAGYKNKLLHTKLGATCTGLTNYAQNQTASGPTGILTRGWLENHHALKHFGVNNLVYGGQLVADNEYVTGAQLRLIQFLGSDDTQPCFMAIEESNLTWDAPIG